MPDFTRKCFKNDICKACIKNQMAKYGKFDIVCDGITVEEDVNLGIKEGLTEEEAKWLFDPAYFFEKVYGHKPRWYQHRILYCTARQLAGRQCRQTGKTLLFMYKILHYVQTNKNKTVLVLAPRENQVKKIWDEYILRDAVNRSDTIKASVTGKVMSPYYQITFDNGSKIILMIAGPGARGQSADWVYIDEAAMISSDMLSDILMTIAGKGADDATILMTSTPMGRGNVFYDACKTNSEFNEYHVSIHEVEEMKNQIPKFKKLLGDTGFIQECEAEFPDASGGPFNYKGIDLSKYAYEYENATKEPGWLYFGGVDWNGPNIGTYFYVVAFNPETYHIKVVDKAVVSSAVWNSTVAKQKFIELNRKWNPKHWMTDFGYGHSINEELKYWSTYKLAPDIPGNHPDAMLKHTIEPVDFGSWTEIKDPFTGEELKKTTKSFIVSQVSRLFEPFGDSVSITISETDNELIKSLENYKLLQITDKGVEKYGFDKKDDIEDHCLDSFSLAVYGIVKHYSELFEQIFLISVPIDARSILRPVSDIDVNTIPHGSNIILITDNSPEPIELDGSKIKDIEDEAILPIIARTFNKNIVESRPTLNSIMKRRNSYVISRSLNI